MTKTTGTVIVQSSSFDLSPELVLEVEHTLNNEVAALVYDKHKVGVRFHLEFKVK